MPKISGQSVISGQFQDSFEISGISGRLWPLCDAMDSAARSACWPLLMAHYYLHTTTVVLNKADIVLLFCLYVHPRKNNWSEIDASWCQYVLWWILKAVKCLVGWLWQWLWELFLYFWIRKLLITWKLLVRNDSFLRWLVLNFIWC